MGYFVSLDILLSWVSEFYKVSIFSTTVLPWLLTSVCNYTIATLVLLSEEGAGEC